MDELDNARNVVEAELYVWDCAFKTIVIMKLPDKFPVAGNARIVNRREEIFAQSAPGCPE